MTLIRPVDLNVTPSASFSRQFAGCIVLSHDGKILLQQRGDHWDKRPGCLATFGGGIEVGETPLEGLVRELNEELGAVVDPAMVIGLGAFTEEITAHTELIHGYFWHDKDATITGCYEGDIAAYDSVEDALTHPKIMDDVKWLLAACLEQGRVR